MSAISVLDARCARGKAINPILQPYPKSKFTGYDLSEEAIKDATLDAQSRNNEI